jgi:hypothetical protein
MTALARSAAIVNDKSILSDDRMLHKGHYHKSSVKKKSSRRSQGAWRQDELNGGKPPVAK